MTARFDGVLARALACALGAAFALAPVATRAEPRAFRIWPSPSQTRAPETGEEPAGASVGTPDVEQLEEIPGSHAPIAEGEPSGFTFVPRRAPLAAFELRLGNKGDVRPGRIALYRWRGSREATLADDPLWTDRIDLDGRDAPRVHRFRVGLDVDVGATYYVELRADGRGSYLIKHSDGRDAYPDGQLFTRGRWWPTRDPWLRTFVRGDVQRQWSAPELVVLGAALPAHEPAERVVAASRRTYFQRVARFAHARRAAARNACGRRAEEAALFEAFLYRASCEEGRCDEKYARSARDLYRDAWAWRACRKGSTLARRRDAGIDARPARCANVCESDDAVEWNPMARPTTAYLWTQSSSAYTEADRALVRALLADLAERFWEKRELGTHNRALQGMALYRAVSDLVPDHPHAPEWRAYSDRVFRELRGAGDTREDSSEYATVVWWPALLEYLSISGLESDAFAEPWLRALVERAYQGMTPIGPAADFGNSVGFGRDTAGWVWLFEAAARQYGEPWFREAARRAFAFHETSVRDRPPEVDALDQTMAALAWATFATDDRLAAAPPAPRREAPIAAATVEAAREVALAAGRTAGRTFASDAPTLVRIQARVVSPPGAAVDVVVREAATGGATLYRERLRADADGVVRALPFLTIAAGRDYRIEVAAPSDGPESGVRVDVGDDGDLALQAFSLEGMGSVVTTRRPVRPVAREDYGPPPYYMYAFEDRRVPDKLVLRNGFDRDAFHAVFNLVRNQGHGEEELGALVSLVDGGSLLLQDGPYPYWTHQLARQDESRPVVVRYAGGRDAPDPVSLDVRLFLDAREAAVARLAWTEPGARGTEVARNVLFAKDGLMLVRDCFASPVPLEASFGSVWHATDLEAEHGATWYDAFVRSPLANVFRLRNRSRKLFVEFVERPGARVEAFLEPSYLPTDEACAARPDADTVAPDCRHGPPYVLAQRFAATLEPGADRCVDTLLVPHAASTPGARVHEGVRLLARGRRAIALEVRAPDSRTARDGGAPRAPAEAATWLFADDPLGEGLEAKDLSVHATLVLARVRPDGAPYVFALDATRVRWRGVDRSWSSPVSVELGGSLPPTNGARP